MGRVLIYTFSDVSLAQMVTSMRFKPSAVCLRGFEPRRGLFSPFGPGFWHLCFVVGVVFCEGGGCGAGGCGWGGGGVFGFGGGGVVSGVGR